ncbi:MAG: TolB family protein [Anaerolineales bacterium]
MKTRFLLITLLAMLIAACNPVEVGVETPTASAPPSTPTAAPLPTATIIPVPADANPYTLAEAGVSLLIPAGWQVSGPVQMQGFSLYTLGPDAGSSGGPGLSQLIVANEAFTIEEFAQQQCSVCPANPIIDSTVGGKPGKRTVIGGGSAPEAEWYFVTHNGKLIGLSIRPRDGQRFDWVMQTITFQNTAPSGNTQTYRNDAFGFELQIPAGWPVTLLADDGSFGYLGENISFTVSPLDPLECRGDCPVVNSTEPEIGIGNLTATRIRGYYGAVGGNIPHEYLAYLFQREGRFYTFTLHAVGRNETSGQADVIVPLPAEAAPPFDQILGTLQFTPISAPRFACSIAYANDMRAFCLGEGATAIPTAEATAPNRIENVAISSDGAWVAYLTSDPNTGIGELWAVDVRGLTGNNGLGLPRRMLANGANIPNSDAQWINTPKSFQWQAGTHVLFFDTRFAPAAGQITGPGEYINNDLWRVDVESGDVTNVLPKDEGGDFTLSPDGHRIAVSGATSIQRMNADGSDRHNVIEFPAIITYSEYQYKPLVVWSADSAYLSVAVPSADPLAADSSLSIFRVSADGNAADTVGRLPGNFVFGGPLGPWLSRDGQRLVYGQSREGVTDLWLTNADGSNPTVFASNSLSANGWGWSPDSEWYAYGIVPEGGNFLLRQNGALQEFGAGLTIVGLEWVDATSFYFIAVSGNANYGVYFPRIGDPTQVLVSGLNPGLSFDVR